MTRTIPTPRSNENPAIQNPAGESANIREIKLNHPKNYLAVPLAVATDGDTDELISQYAVNLPNRVKRGAVELGLVGTEETLTEFGEAVLIQAKKSHESPRAGLEAFGELYRSQKRFVDELPEWEGLTTHLAHRYGPTTHLVKFLRQQGPLMLHELVWLLWDRKPSLAQSVFLHPEKTTDDISDNETRPKSATLSNPDNFRSEATFQYKAYLYHCGIIESRGDYTSRLKPMTDEWRLKS